MLCRTPGQAVLQYFEGQTIHLIGFCPIVPHCGSQLDMQSVSDPDASSVRKLTAEGLSRLNQCSFISLWRYFRAFALGGGARMAVPPFLTRVSA